MKRAIGIDFTDYTVRVLREKGFSLAELTVDVGCGFRRFLCPLQAAESGFDGFEIHVVEDEEAYLRHARIEHFFPYVRESVERGAAVSNSNTVDGFVEVIEPARLGNRELREALELRKQFRVGALRLRCGDFAKFVGEARPKRVYQDGGRELALVHLGPSCFDLVVGAD